MPRGEKEKQYMHPAHNRCPINFVVGGLPLTATITVVRGGWRPPREAVRARILSLSPFGYGLCRDLLEGQTRETATRHFISTGSPARGIFIYTRDSCALSIGLSFRSLSPSLISLHSFFLQTLFPTIVSRDYATRNDDILYTYHRYVSFRNFFLCFASPSSLFLCNFGYNNFQDSR